MTEPERADLAELKKLPAMFENIVLWCGVLSGRKLQFMEELGYLAPGDVDSALAAAREDLPRLIAEVEESRRDTERLEFALKHLVIYDEHGAAKATGMDDTRRIYDTRGALDEAIAALAARQGGK
jgi:hypothetical protein